MAAPGDGTVVVTSRAGTRLTHDVAAGIHTLVADEPTGVGDDLGPTPYELLLAALGTCTAMTLRLYAEKKGWSLEGVAVTLHHARVHADDCVDCERDTSYLDRIDVALTLTGDLSAEQRDALVGVAERCPVHRTLMGDKRIVISLTPSPTA